MTREEVLEQQVEALEKLLKLKQAIIEEHEAKIARLDPYTSYRPPAGPVWITNNDNSTCLYGGFHDYQPSTTPLVAPQCTKCGKYMQTITIGGSSLLAGAQSGASGK